MLSISAEALGSFRETDMLRTKALDMDLRADRHTLAFPELQLELIKMFGI